MLLVAVAAHLVEEFLWPGGFGPWYRRHYPDRAASLTPGFLVRINALLVVLAVIAGIQGVGPRGVALWLTLASISAANGFFHLLASVRTRTYSPGLVTGMLLYVPLAIYGFWYLLHNGQASAGTALLAGIAGPAYHLYSAAKHRRRSRGAAPTA
jgi:hypothetical protein